MINAMMLDGGDNKSYVIPVIGNARKARDTTPILNLYKGEVFNTAATDLGAAGAARAMLRKNISKMLLESTQATKAQKASSHVSGYSSSIQEFEGSAMNLLKKLQRERMILTRLGFSEKAEKLDIEIDRVRKEALKQRDKEFEKLYSEHLSVLEKKQERRGDRLDAILRRKKDDLDTKLKNEYNALLESHQQEFLNLYANTERKAIGKVSKCNCQNEYVCQHNKSSSYNTRRPKPQVVLYRSSSKRLKQGGRSEDAVALMELANTIDYEDQDAWRKKVSASITQSPWGANASIMDRMIEEHKKQIDIIKQTHSMKVKANGIAADRRRQAVANMSNSEKSRLRTRCRKMYEKILTERARKEHDNEKDAYSDEDDFEQIVHPPIAAEGGSVDGEEDEDDVATFAYEEGDEQFDYEGEDKETRREGAPAEDSLGASERPPSPDTFLPGLTVETSPVFVSADECVEAISKILDEVGRLKTALLPMKKSPAPTFAVQATACKLLAPSRLPARLHSPPASLSGSIDGVGSHNGSLDEHIDMEPQRHGEEAPTKPILSTSPAGALRKSFSKSVSFSVNLENDDLPLQPSPPLLPKSTAASSSPNGSMMANRALNSPGSLRDEDWAEQERILGNGLENSYGVSFSDVDAAVAGAISSMKGGAKA